MGIIRVFPRKTSYTPSDEYVFVGEPPLFRPEAEEVHVSVTFTWDIDYGKHLLSAWSKYYPKVLIGGPALGNITTNFQPGRYVKTGVTFTTRGCDNNCPWCLVHSKEGKLVEIADFAEGNIIQDNNLLMASRTHIEKVFSMLRMQKRAAIFAGGLQASLIDDWFVDLLKTIRLDSLFLAADTYGALIPLEKALNKLAGFERRKLRVYCMIGMNETMDQAEQRLEAVWKLGGLPFAQLYQPPEKFIDYSSDWKALVRKWSRPAAMFTSHKNTGEDIRNGSGKEVSYLPVLWNK
jgi:hypothetical protein